MDPFVLCHIHIRFEDLCLNRLKMTSIAKITTCMESHSQYASCFKLLTCKGKINVRTTVDLPGKEK